MVTIVQMDNTERIRGVTKCDPILPSALQQKLVHCTQTDTETDRQADSNTSKNICFAGV